MCDTFNIVVGLISILSFIYALYQSNEKRKLSRFTLSVLQGSSGNLCKAQQSTQWAFENIQSAQELSSELIDSEIKKELIIKISNAKGDIAAADRLLINLFEQFMTIQKSHFGTRDITHPEKYELKLWLKELESRKK